MAIDPAEVKIIITNINGVLDFIDDLNELTDMIPDYYPEKEVLIKSVMEKLKDLIDAK